MAVKGASVLEAEEGTEMSAEEQQKLLDLFKELKLKPKVDSVQDFTGWMSNQFSATKQEADLGAKPKFQAPPSPMFAPPSFPAPFPMHPPRLSFFSGDKKDADYDVWKYEVLCLQREGIYAPESILHAVRRSVKGEAARVLMNLGPTASIKDVVNKFDSVYGSVHMKQSILASFYSCKQAQHEDVSTFSNRMVDLLNKAVEQGTVNKSSANEMLCSVFYSGLKPSLRDICAYKFDQIKTFDDLLLAVRRTEKEHEGQLSSIVNQCTVESDTQSQIKQLTSVVNQLVTEVKSLRENKPSNYTSYDDSIKNNANPPTSNTRIVPEKKRIDREQEHYVKTNYNACRNKSNSVNNFALRQSNEVKDIVCFRCLRKGHFRRSCVAKYDIHGNYLN
ncbi:MAG: hypothetical protein KZQ70_12890 [gamma proteobacterium symbiont of Lucinoma myriamae]|nr:hypothetical protein [gamma proteobacterium symbiont of Lucinoma myriamae]